MTRRFMAFLCLAMLGILAGYAVGQDKKKFADLEGTWTIVKMEAAGKSLLEKEEKWKIIIKDGKVTSDAKDAPKEGKDLAKYLDPSKKPKEVELILAQGEKTALGIYERSGDTYKLCYAAPGQDRPKEFSAKEGTRYTLSVWQRKKK